VIRLKAHFKPRLSSGRFKGFHIFLLILGLLGAIELYRVITPFNSLNPFWKEISLGGQIFPGYYYNGQDEEGYLKFYNAAQSFVIPPSSRLIEYQGHYAVIEAYTPGTLTYANPIDAIPLRWVVIGSGVFAGIAFTLWTWVKAKRNRRPLRLSNRHLTTRSTGNRHAKENPPVMGKRFKSR